MKYNESREMCTCYILSSQILIIILKWWLLYHQHLVSNIYENSKVFVVLPAKTLLTERLGLKWLRNHIKHNPPWKVNFRHQFRWTIIVHPHTISEVGLWQREALALPGGNKCVSVRSCSETQASLHFSLLPPVFALVRYFLF